jgi:hypothetical protein
VLDHGANLKTIGEIDGTDLHLGPRYALRVDNPHIEMIKLLLDYSLEINTLALEMGGTVVSS